MKKLKISSPFYIVKRMDLTKRDAWLIRVGGMIAALFLSAIMCTLLSPGTFGSFFLYIFKGTFSTSSYVLNLCCCLATYLLLSLAVTPAFKMKFWNIGAEGQAMAGCIVTAVILLLMPASIPGPVVIIFALIVAILAGMFWALIPTFFKIKFNTNETLFTLMMNYIATALASFTIAKCTLGGSGIFPMITDQSRLIVTIGGVKYIPFILCAVIFTAIMILYLGKAKHGFELSIMGDSVNTARYVGISIKKVTLRTMALSGAIAGLVGFLLVCGQHKTLTSTLVGGKGFTAVLIAWLGHFNPSEIALYSFVIGFLDQGTTYAASQVKISRNYFSGVVLGLFVLVIIVAEFFVRYQVKRHLPNEVSEVKSDILNSQDKDISKETLLKEFISVDTLNFKVKVNNERYEFKAARKKYLSIYSKLKKQLLFNFKLNIPAKDKLRKELANAKKEYDSVKNQYQSDKETLRIKYQIEKTIVKTNAIRIKRAIKGKMMTSLVVFKSGTISYPTKEELERFLNSVNYTNWVINKDVSYKNIFNSRKIWKQKYSDFNSKLKQGKTPSLSEIKNADSAFFNYLVVRYDRSVFYYLKQSKVIFKSGVKFFNNRNLRALKKKGANSL